MASDREAPTRPDAPFPASSPLPGPPREPGRLPLPQPSLRLLIFCSPSFRIDTSVPCFSPKLSSGSRGALARHAVPWHRLRLSPTGCQSVAPSSSLSQPLTGEGDCLGVGQRKAGTGGTPCPLPYEQTVTHQKLGSQPASCLSPASSSFKGCLLALPAAPPPLPQGGSPRSQRGSLSTGRESGDLG